MKNIKSQILIIALFISGIVYSQTGWIKLNSGTTDTINSLYFTDLNTGYAIGWYGRILKTTNGGLNWNRQNAGTGGTLYSITFTDNNTGFISSDGSYRTTNGGVNWIWIANFNFSYEIQFANQLTGYSAGPGHQVMKTTNGGLNWEFKDPSSIHSFYTLSVVDANIVYFVPGANLIYKTTTGGDSYTNFPVPLFPYSICFPNENTGYISGESANRYSVIKTTNGGNNWVTLLSSTEMSLGGPRFLNDQTGFIIGCSWNPGYTSYIFKTTDGGAVWTKSAYIDNGLNSLYFVNEKTGYAAGFDGTILKTTDGGNLTTHSVSGIIRYQDNNQPVVSGNVKAVKYYPQSNQFITLDSAIIQPNGTYTLPHVPQDSADIMAFQDDEDNAAFVPTYYVSTIYWQNATTLFPDTNLTGIDVLVYRNSPGDDNFHIGGMINRTGESITGISGAIVYAKSGNLFKGYSVSSNTGNYRIDKLSSGSYDIIADRMGYTSSNLPAQLNNSNINNFNFILQGFLFGIDPPGGKVPENFWLGQNYPNPFNPETEIKFGLPKETYVTLKIYDILGREIGTLVNEELNAGEYKVKWNASGLSSGIYFYRLVSGDIVISKKLVLIK